MGWIHFGFAEALAYYQNLFPHKEMWITEWNIANPANRVANTQLHAMYVGDFFLKMLTIPNITQQIFMLSPVRQRVSRIFSRNTDNARDFLEIRG